MTNTINSHTHQPPWEPCKSGIYSADGYCVAMRHPQAGEEWERNALILAAAPVILDAAVELMEVLRGMAKGPQHDAMVKLHNAIMKAMPE